MPEQLKPMDIEARSMAIIEEHLTGVTLPEPERSILKRVIHTTADFDYTENLCFSENAVSSALEALQRGAHIVTDTNMALSGINKRSTGWGAKRIVSCPMQTWQRKPKCVV